MDDDLELLEKEEKKLIDTFLKIARDTNPKQLDVKIIQKLEIQCHKYRRRFESVGHKIGFAAATLEQLQTEVELNRLRERFRKHFVIARALAEEEELAALFVGVPEKIQQILKSRDLDRIQDYFKETHHNSTAIIALMLSRTDEGYKRVLKDDEQYALLLQLKIVGMKILRGDFDDVVIRALNADVGGGMEKLFRK